MVMCAAAQTSVPSVPQFSVAYVDHTYVYPKAYGTDPYSGKTVQTGGGFTVVNVTVEVTVRNQPFTSYTQDGKPINLYYRLMYKGHYEDQWQYYTKRQTINSDTTIFWIGLAWDGWSNPDIRLYNGGLAAGDKMDFRVQTQIGYFGLEENRLYPGGYATNYDELHGQASDWSPIQTFTMPGTPSPTPFSWPTATPQAPTATSQTTLAPADSVTLPFTAVAAIAAVIIALAAALLLLIRKQTKTPPAPKV